MATWRDTRVSASSTANPLWRDTRIGAEVSYVTTARWRDTRVAAEIQTSLIPPTADGGPSRSASAGEKVTMDSSGSSSVQGTIASRTWRYISGSTGAPTPVLSSTTATVVTFNAPPWDQDGIYNFGLTVTDSNGLTSSEDVVTVSVAAADLSVATSTGWKAAGLLMATSGGWA